MRANNLARLESRQNQPIPRHDRHEPLRDFRYQDIGFVFFDVSPVDAGRPNEFDAPRRFGEQARQEIRALACVGIAEQENF